MTLLHPRGVGIDLLTRIVQDLMKLTGKATPKLVTKDGAEGRLFQLVAWLTGMKNALKG